VRLWETEALRSENGEPTRRVRAILPAMAPYDPERLYRALLARDSRFDGMFFVGVTSTRIYCRPVCPAPAPRSDRCRYYASAAAAERRGFRPCLRCRPELAPGRALDASREADAVASIDAVERLARAAAARIAAGALDRGSLDDLAAELGVSGRHLRRSVERVLGATPVALAQTRRLLTAKQLLTETDLPVTQVAIASGFSSLRRFNALFREQYRLAPTGLRRAGIPVATADAPSDRPPSSAGVDASITLSLAYRPPLEWPTLHAYLAGRATPGVEAAGHERGGWYARTISLGSTSGWVLVSPRSARRRRGRDGVSLHDHALSVELSTSLLPMLVPLLARLRRLFDLDAVPGVIDAHLVSDERLAPLVRRRPGLRLPGAVDAAELTVRAILGQQVSVRGATTLAGRLIASLGESIPPDERPLRPELAPLTHRPLEIARLADASAERIAAIGLTRARAEALRATARAIADGMLPDLTATTPVADPAALVRRMLELPGVGSWTAEYVVMRALQWPDAFPSGDLGLRKAMGGLSPAKLRIASERWRPWRAYAAQHLWAGASDAPPAISARPARRAARRTSGAER
jgi:AraC family transcriptional regulator, regulatory protein of adaptative response / DNA-3-methyladenine glycosylase II